MTDVGVCPHCEALRDVEVVSDAEETTVKGVVVLAEVVYSRCTTCLGEFSTPAQMDESLNNAYRGYDDRN